ncbi:hypothetical protein [Streptomyces galilaeus]|uniref:hypothetical protein n=1 Tax=Streptomyces galilaeus TaxID=33899 RepID=UPI001E562A24|nr:hypothetical protein [Streptomyces galilaeus]
MTNNSKDFSDGTSHPYPLNEDIRGMEHRLTLLQDFDQVVSQFTEAVSGKDAEAAALELLKSASVREGVAQAAGLSTLTGFAGRVRAPRWSSGTRGVRNPRSNCSASRTSRTTGSKTMNGTRRRPRWLLYGLAVDEMEALSGYIACVWETKVLFSTREGCAAGAGRSPRGHRRSPAVG